MNSLQVPCTACTANRHYLKGDLFTQSRSSLMRVQTCHRSVELGLYAVNIFRLENVVVGELADPILYAVLLSTTYSVPNKMRAYAPRLIKQQQVNKKSDHGTKDALLANLSYF